MIARISDGRRLLLLPKRGPVTIPGVASGESARISIRAIDAALLRGPEATLRVKPVRKKRRRR